MVWTKFELPDDPSTKELASDMRAQIDDYVDKTFCQAVPEENVSTPAGPMQNSSRHLTSSQVIWFKNWKALKSIHSVEHFHVMLFDPDPNLIDQVTHGDIPLSRKIGGAIK